MAAEVVRIPALVPYDLVDVDAYVSYAETLQKTKKVAAPILLLANVETQTLHVMDQEGNCKKSYTISTGKNGVGSKSGSGRTPLGLHSIAEKIGDGESPDERFDSREKKGPCPNDGGEYIISRILWLQGEEARNQSTHDRYIYIHGTNQDETLGEPKSLGCIRMNRNDVIELFNAVKDQQAHVYIYDPSGAEEVNE